MRRSGKGHYPQREKKSKGVSKKNPESLSLRYFSAPPPGGPPLRYSRKTSVAVMLVVFALFFHQTFERKQTIRSRRGFLKGENRGRHSRGVAAQTRKRINAPAPAQTAVWRQVVKAREDCFWSLQTLFAPFSHKAQRTSTNSGATPSEPPSQKQRATESPASIFGLKLFARFLDERLLSHIRIDQLFWARLRSVPLNRPSGLLVRCFRVLSLNARATGDGPLPRALHYSAKPTRAIARRSEPRAPLRERRQAARDLGVLAQAMATAMATANVQETGRAAMNATVVGLFARLTNRPAQLSPRKGRQALT